MIELLQENKDLGWAKNGHISVRFSLATVSTKKPWKQMEARFKPKSLQSPQKLYSLHQTNSFVILSIFIILIIIIINVRHDKIFISM